MCKKYKPNNVYVLEIHGCQYYVGCHTQKEEMTESEILWGSANPLRKAYENHLITPEEYKECCQVISIEEYDTPQEALNRETELIAEFKEKYENFCLNKSKGNIYGFSGCSHSEEAKKKISEVHKGRPAWNKGIPLSEEAKKHISEALKGIKMWPNGRVFSEEHKQHLSESHKGKHVSEETKKKISIAFKNHPTLSKPVLQFTKDGQFIAEYPSISEASRQTGIAHNQICSCCQGKYGFKTAGNFKWKYKEVA